MGVVLGGAVQEAVTWDLAFKELPRMCLCGEGQALHPPIQLPTSLPSLPAHPPSIHLPIHPPIPPIHLPIDPPFYHTPIRPPTYPIHTPPHRPPHLYPIRPPHRWSLSTSCVLGTTLETRGTADKTKDTPVPRESTSFGTRGLRAEVTLRAAAHAKLGAPGAQSSVAGPAEAPTEAACLSRTSRAPGTGNASPGAVVFR